MLAHDRKSACKRERPSLVIYKNKYTTISWGCSSTGRALEWHSRGKGFDPPHLHHKKTSRYKLLVFFIYDGDSLRGGRTRALRKQWTPIVFSDDRSALCGIHLYKHFCHTKCKNDPLSFFDEGLHNSAQCNYVAVKPLRAGAHSLVQAHSFHYYGTLCLRPTLISTNDNHIRTLFETGCLFLCKIKSPDSCQDLLLLGCLDIVQVPFNRGVCLSMAERSDATCIKTSSRYSAKSHKQQATACAYTCFVFS